MNKAIPDLPLPFAARAKMTLEERIMAMQMESAMQVARSREFRSAAVKIRAEFARLASRMAPLIKALLIWMASV